MTNETQFSDNLKSIFKSETRDKSMWGETHK